MRKAGLIFIFLALLITLEPAWGAEEATTPKKVLLIYESNFYWNSNEDVVKAFDLLLHHFPVETKIIRSREYQAGLISQYDAAVYLPMEIMTCVPAALLKDIANTSVPLLWVGENFDQYVRRNPQLGIRVLGRSDAFPVNIYKDKSMTDKRKITSFLLEAAKGQILAYMSDGVKKYPLALTVSNLWYIGRLDFRERNVNVTADLLHDFLGISHQEEHQAFIRIEDVHLKRNPAELKALADCLAEEGVPFMIALTPVYISQKGERTTLSDVPELADAIRYMVEKGGSIVLHGYTHQMDNEETGVGFEFWDRKNNRPLMPADGTYVADRLDAAVMECVKNGLYPLAFEPPHYGMSEEGYLTVRAAFSTLVAQVQTSNKGFSTTTFPFRIGSNSYASRVIPENLSMVNSALPDPVSPLLAKSWDMLTVRDGTAGLFFHPWMNLNHLREVVKGLRNQGYDFIDLQKEANWVSTPNCSIESENGLITHRINNYSAPKPVGAEKSLGGKVLAVLKAIWKNLTDRINLRGHLQISK